MRQAQENEKWIKEFSGNTSSEVTTRHWQDNIKVNRRGNGREDVA
jgi:hypothetical protein